MKKQNSIMNMMSMRMYSMCMMSAAVFSGESFHKGAEVQTIKV